MPSIILEDAFGLMVFLFRTLEGWSFILGLIYVVLSVRKNIHAWWFAIAASIIYGLVCWESKLYPTLFLQIFFVISSIYGVLEWRKANNNYSKSNWSYTKLSSSAWLFFVSLIFVIAGLSLLLIAFYSGVPKNNVWFYVEIFAVAASLIAQYLEAKRCIHAWPLWFIINIAYIFINALTSLYSIAVLYALLAILSISGYRYWKKHNNANINTINTVNI